jgi:hypothetical protein
MFKERNPQKTGKRGSLKWIQILLDRNPQLLTDAIRTTGQLPSTWDVRWLSPRKDDEWSEYRDNGFLIQLGLSRLIPQLEKFWPRGGPQWDALGKANDESVVLVEAKAYPGELASSCGAGAESLVLINQSLNAAKTVFGARESSQWNQGYYQYANRLAHLDFLRRNGVNARLVFLYFCGDSEMDGPDSALAWKEKLDPIYKTLGLESLNDPDIVSVFLNVGLLAAHMG